MGFPFGGKICNLKWRYVSTTQQVLQASEYPSMAVDAGRSGLRHGEQLSGLMTLFFGVLSCPACHCWGGGVDMKDTSVHF